MTDMKDVLRLMNHIAAKWGGQIVMAEQTSVTASGREIQVCVDVRDNVMVAYREVLRPMISHIQTAMGHFPNIVVEEIPGGYQAPTNESKKHQIFFRLTEGTSRPPQSSNDFDAFRPGRTRS